MTDPHDAELVWRSPMMQPEPVDITPLIAAYRSAYMRAGDTDALARLDDAVETMRQRYRSGYDVETGRIWPAA